MTREAQRRTRHPVATHADAGRPKLGVGKRTLSDAAMCPSGGAPVQRRAARDPATQVSDAVHAAAARGTSGSAEALPHLDRIQRLFGRHDVSGVRAYVGGNAAAGAQAMGASAFATGDQVAFASSPDLHTAAHEAAHVVQQRGEVQLKGGVGQQGDRYEQHADAVADLVVAGKSAEALLDAEAPTPGRGAASGAVQRTILDNDDTPMAWLDVLYAIGGLINTSDAFSKLHEMWQEWTPYSITEITRALTPPVSRARALPPSLGGPTITTSAPSPMDEGARSPSFEDDIEWETVPIEGGASPSGGEDDEDEWEEVPIGGASAQTMDDFEDVEWEEGGSSVPEGGGGWGANGTLTITIPMDTAARAEAFDASLFEPAMRSPSVSDEESVEQPAWPCAECRCCLGARLGGGDYADVFVNASDPTQVVKVAHEGMEMYLEQEATIYEKLEGSNIGVRCVSSCVGEVRQPHLVLERADGTLEDYLREHREDREATATMVGAVSSKVTALNERGIAHRDLYNTETDMFRTDNVMVKGGEPYLIDFGLAEEIDQSYVPRSMRKSDDVLYAADRKFLLYLESLLGTQ